MLYIELAIVIVLILVNGLLALAELAIVSSRRARLQALVDREVIGSSRALALASNPGRFLSTVQVGISGDDPIAAGPRRGQNWLTETRLRGWACKIRTQKRRRKLSL